MQTAIALGTFDGIHKGHRAVLDAVLPYNSAVVSFNIPPKGEMSGNPELLMLPERKVAALKKYGIEQVHLLDFNTIRDLSPEDFLNRLCEKFSPKLISCGYNYRFGKNAAGNTEYLAEYCRSHSIEFNCTDCVCDNGIPVNSTMLRNMLKAGEVEKANRQIYGGFCFTAPVLHGDERGRTIGFPTVNQKYPESLVTLKFGVYAVKILIDGIYYDGIANIGIRPTWRTECIMSETYIINFKGDLYGKILTVKPIRFLRPEKHFNSLDELKNTISDDISVMNRMETEGFDRF